MGLRSVNLIVLPSQTLGDTETPPFFFVKNFEGTSLRIKIIFRDLLEHWLGEHDVTTILISDTGLKGRVRSDEPVLVGVVRIAVSLGQCTVQTLQSSVFAASSRP